MDLPQAHRSIEAVWKIESARLIGGLVRMVKDLSAAEDLAQEALVLALEHWPESGIPDNPGAWLMATAKNLALDSIRHRSMKERRHAELANLQAPAIAAPNVEALDEDVGDDVLRLMLVACHPVLSAEARTALTLRLLGGLSTHEIARAFLVPEATVAQRIVRAKRTLTEARVPFSVPRGAELSERLPGILSVLYLIFNEGYAAAAGEDWIRPELCAEALRLGRVLAALLPQEAEVHGLVALMEIQASRARARLGASGEIILLQDQDRGKWDYLAIERGIKALARAESLARPLGPYTLQAAIAACHARAKSVDQTDWERIVALYDALVEITGSPVVELNRAVAVGMALGPEAGLDLVDELASEPSLRAYHLVHCVRADLLARLGRFEEARSAFERAAFMTKNARERALLLARARSPSGRH